MTNAAHTVTRTELNQQTARVLARVEAGERLIVTDHGRAIAELVPRSTESWDDLVAAGVIAPAARTGALERPPADRDALSSAEILDDIRRDRA